jgi:hypothetical protein
MVHNPMGNSGDENTKEPDGQNLADIRPNPTVEFDITPGARVWTTFL